MTAEVFAPAKINLTLHVTGQRADGYHLLDSLVIFSNVGDRLWITPADEISLEVVGPFAKGVPSDSRNLIWQAAELAGRSAHIKVEKNLPHGAGIGGGSSDAAAVLRHFRVTDGAAQLGADVPVCLAAKASRMRGIGDQITLVEGLPKRLWAVLVNPMVHVPTPAVFAGLTQKTHAPMPDPLPALRGDREWLLWLGQMRNDLEVPAIVQAPVIAEALHALKAWNPFLARMSGSGATCFALFGDQGMSEIAASRLAADHPDWWVRDVALS